ncbi:hypothetical protein COBT_002069 [Conglomerata obtusa]
MASNTSQEPYANKGSKIDKSVNIVKRPFQSSITLNNLKDKIKDTLKLGKETVIISTSINVHKEDDELQSIGLWIKIVDFLERLMRMKTPDYRGALDTFTEELNKLKADFSESNKPYVQEMIKKTSSIFDNFNKKLALESFTIEFTEQLFVLELLCKFVELELDDYLENKNNYAKESSPVEKEMTNPFLSETCG